MPTPTKGPRLGGGPAHERLLLANLAGALFEHGRITTTLAKAKRLRPVAEHMITFAKRGDLHARRQVARTLRDPGVLHTLFAEIGPRYAERAGGYTRIVKVGARKGDNAEMAVIELVEGQTVAQQAVGEAERARGTRFRGRRAPTPATAEAAADLAGESAVAAGVAAEAEASEAEASDAGAADVGAADVGDEERAGQHEQIAVPAEGGDTEGVTEPAAAEPAGDAEPVAAADVDNEDEGGAEPE